MQPRWGSTDELWKSWQGGDLISSMIQALNEAESKQTCCDQGWTEKEIKLISDGQTMRASLLASAVASML